ncbi:MAG: GNAT family N-acetyltransferase [Paracoccaceae bacterium]
MDSLTVFHATPDMPGVQALLQTHVDLMRASSPAESCHVMEGEALVDADAVLLALCDGDAVLGVGALKPLDAAHGELKSMHTAAAARGRGVARRILLALVDEARDMGLTRLSLETGSADQFAAARALYANNGFEDCPPFAPYEEDPLSVFMTRVL